MNGIYAIINGNQSRMDAIEHVELVFVHANIEQFAQNEQICGDFFNGTADLQAVGIVAGGIKTARFNCKLNCELNLN